MQVFQSEIDDNLEAKLTSSASISYATVVEPCSQITNPLHIKKTQSIAAINDNDLYYIQSILVTSSWNKNDDIFDKSEVWLARNTPEDKPTNLEHDEGTIIGHITSNWPITEDGLLIDENTSIEQLPEKYHILTGSVIYKAFTNPELKDRAENLIAQIEQGDKYVSMECFFKGFDYGLIDQTTGQYKVLARNDDTAYLTKYLRSYGGEGQHDNYKIGRVLRNITFSGKGFVDKPANPDSIIFTKELLPDRSSNKIISKNEDFSNTGVSLTKSNLNVENNTMNLEQEISDLKLKVEAMASCPEIVKEAYVLAAQLRDKVLALEVELGTAEKSLSNLQSVNEELSSQNEALSSQKEEAALKVQSDVDLMNVEVQKLQSSLDEANEIIATYKMQEVDMQKKAKKMKRVASLIELGVDGELATSTVDKFEGLDDESFDAMTTLFAGKMPPWLEKIKKGDKNQKTEDKTDKKKAAEDFANPSLLETAEVEDTVNLSVGGETEESAIESTRAALVEFVCSRLGKTL